MPIINGKPFTQLTNLNITGDLLTNGTSLGEALIDSSSTASTQLPTALDTPLQIEFGAAQENDFVSLEADGTITVSRTAFYQFIVNLTFGRNTNAGDAILLGRYTVNGVQPANSNSVSATLPNQTIRIPKQITVIGRIPAGSEVKFEIARDSSGVNNGGLFSQSAATLGWALAPTASIQIYKVE